MSSRLGRLLRVGGKRKKLVARTIKSRRGTPVVAEILESRMLLYSPSFTPTTTNVADHINGPLANAGQNLISLYLGYEAYAADAGSGNFADSPENPLGTKLIELEGDSVGVDVRGQGDFGAFTQALSSIGMTVQNTDAAAMTVEGLLPLADLPAVAEFAPTISVQPIYNPTFYSVGSAPNQGEQVSQADLAKSQYDVDGTGVTIGILSDSVNQYEGGLADSVASGDLPNNVDVLEDGDAGGTDEGRAMLEEVHDIAPGSGLAFHTGEGGELNFGSGITQLATTAGAKVIDDDLGYADEPFFQPGIVSQAIDGVVANDNVAYFSSAGNAGESGYQSVFRGVNGTVTGVGTGRFMNFNPGSGAAALTIGINVYEQGGVGPVMQFDQPYYTTSGVKSDVNFYILDSSNNVVASGTDDNIAEQTPIQFSGSLAPGLYKVAIEVVNGPDPGRVEFHEPDDGGFSTDTQYGSAGGTTYPSISGHDANANSITVGAVQWFNAAPFYTPSVGVNNEPYSSFGPVITEFNGDGTPLASPDMILKPNISAADAVTTSFFIPGEQIDTSQASDYTAANPPYPGDPVTTVGWTSTPTNLNTKDLNCFTGTSAAAPNAAAIAALAKQLDPGVSEAEILNAMQTTAIPIDGQAAGVWGPQAGYGLVDALATLTNLSVSITVNPITATQNVAINDAEVATFIDGQNLPVADYTASITWGDGTTTLGTVVANPQGGYEILGSHTYTAGAVYTLSVALTSTGGASATGSATASVSGAPLTGTAYPISETEGDLFDGTIAEFFDANTSPTSVEDYSATIDWGDGTTAIGEILPLAGSGVGDNAYEIVGSHAYEAGNYTIKVTVSSDNNSSVVLQSSATIAATPLTAVPVPVQVLEGAVYNGLVATFTNTDPLMPPLTYYSATINWGNGTTETGTIVANPFGPGYAVEGSEYFSAGKYTATVSISDQGGATATVNPTITVRDAPLSGSGINFSAQEGNATQVQIAAYTDADPVPHPGSYYSVAVNWGDGTTSAGLVIPDGQGGYLVFAEHAYVAGSYTFQATITDLGGGASTVLKGTATISPAPITALPVAITASAGTPFLGVVATFKSVATTVTTASFTAQIAWGDGTTSAGAIQVNPKGGFEVVGSHTFANPGNAPVRITIKSNSGAATSTASPTTVSAAPISATGVAIAGNERSVVGGVVAGFTTSDASLSATNFTASINWGDGETTLGSVAAASGGGFLVSGTHTYSLSGIYPVTVSIASSEGAGAVASTSATIAYVPYIIGGGLTGTTNAGATAPNITNQTHPTFTGQALADSMVTVFAQIVGTSGLTPIGTATVGADGNWTVQSTLTLPTGSYNIYAQGTDPGGVVGPVQTLLPSPSEGPLIVDTTGSKVTGLGLGATRAQFQVGLAAGISGLDQATVLNPANYSVEYVSPQGAVTPVAVTGVSLASGSAASGEQVVVSFGNGKKLKAGGYVLTITAAGVKDNAGNGLVENYYVPYPAAYTAPGNNYQAEIVSNGKTTTSPEQFVPPSAAAGARAHEAFIKAHLRTQRAIRRK